MKGKQNNTWIVFLFFVVLWSTSQATTAQEDRLRWNGFLSVGGGMTLDDGEYHLVDPVTNTGYDNRASYRADTTFGLQLQADLNEGLSATAQLIGRGGNEFDAKLEWAYLSYEINDAWTAYAGRKRTPFFYYSESLDVGYSYHWIRPPSEVYGLAFTGYEGLGLRNLSNVGPVSSVVDLFTGRSEAFAPALSGGSLGEVRYDVKDLGGASWTLDYESMVQLRGATARGTLDYTSSTTGTFIEGNNVWFYDLAASVDLGYWFLIGEGTKIQIEKQIDNRLDWLVSSGVRIGKFTPHVTYGERRESATDAPADQQKSVTAGIRFDFHPSACLKLEFTTIQDQSDVENGVHGDADVVSLAIDMVF